MTEATAILNIDAFPDGKKINMTEGYIIFITKPGTKTGTNANCSVYINGNKMCYAYLLKSTDTSFNRPLFIVFRRVAGSIVYTYEICNSNKDFISDLENGLGAWPGKLFSGDAGPISGISNARFNSLKITADKDNNIGVGARIKIVGMQEDT